MSTRAILMASLLFCAATPRVALGGAPTQSVYVIPIEGRIGPKTVGLVQRSIERAERDGARAIVVTLDTPGGYVSSMLQIKDALLDTDIHTYAMVDRHAYSAGALIAIACDDIYMVDGAVMGAAAPIDGNGAPAGEKGTSAVRAAFAATAQKQGRNPKIAEAMVDEDVAVGGLIDRGKLLTLGSDQAVAWGYSDGTVDNLDHLLSIEHLEGAQKVVTSDSPAELLAEWVTLPTVAMILIGLAFIGFVVELASPGFGVGGTVALGSLGLFFAGHSIAGLAGWEAYALVAAGLVLLAMELFVIPGTTVVGVTGALAIVGGLFWAMVGDVSDLHWQTVLDAAGALGGAIVLVTAGSWAILRRLPTAGRRRGLILSEAVQPDTLSMPRGTAEKRGEV